MFTGIVQALGKIIAVSRESSGGSLSIRVPRHVKIRAGASVAVNGVCLTATLIKNNTILCDCMPETFRATNLGELQKGDPVNLETPLTLSAPLGGHLVQGHVDCSGRVVSTKSQSNSRILRIRTPKQFSRYLVAKGSVAVDGVSLTILKVFSDGFSVALIPVTQKSTVLGRKRQGASVNIEVDIVAKYIEKLIKGNS